MPNCIKRLKRSVPPPALGEFSLQNGEKLDKPVVAFTYHCKLNITSTKLISSCPCGLSEETGIHVRYKIWENFHLPLVHGELLYNFLVKTNSQLP